MHECFACIYVCTTCVPDACRGHKRALSFLELELQKAVNPHAGAGNQTQVF